MGLSKRATVDTSILATKMEVQAVASGAPKGAYATLIDLQTAFPTGTTGVYIVASDAKWYYWNGTAWTSGSQYLSSTNVTTSFDFHKLTDGWLTLNRSEVNWTDGQSLKSADGTQTTSGALNGTLQGVTGFISVVGYTHINALIFKTDGLAIAAIAFYDMSGVFLSAYSSNASFSTDFQLIPIPNGATQIKYSYSTDVRADALVRPRWSYLQLYNANALSASQGKTASDVAVLQSRWSPSSQLFDKSKSTNVGFQINTDGSVTADATKCVTDYIPVTQGDVLYSIGGTSESVVFYDSNKTKIGGGAWNFGSGQKNTVSTVGIAYIRTNVKLASVDTFVLSKMPINRYESYLQIPANLISGYGNHLTNWWYNKKGDSLGDSLTGQGFLQKYARYYFNLAKFSNHGIGGTKLAGPANANGDSMWMDSRINALDSDADFLTVLGGQNDGPTAVMGDLSITNSDTNTIAGALNVLISKTLYKYQKLGAGYYAAAGISYAGITQVQTAINIDIILCTPFYVPAEEPLGNGLYRQNIADTVRGIAKLWGLPICDFAAMSRLNSGVADVYWTTDRTHPLETAWSEKLVPVFVGTMERVKPVNYTKAYYIV